MKVLVERYIEGVWGGNRYRGYMKIADTKLDYDLWFDIPIPQLNTMASFENQGNLRCVFKITMRRGDANIELTEEEYGFFFQMLVPFATRLYYNNPQVYDSKEGGVLGEILRKQIPMAAFEETFSYGVICRELYNFPPKLCKMLNNPKFGCALVT